MHEPLLQSNWDCFLYGLPVLGLLFFSMFRLDTLISTPRDGRHRRRVPARNRANGEPLGCDPDGRPWPVRRAAQARFRPG